MGKVLNLLALGLGSVAAQPVIETSYGPVMGAVKNGVATFRSIPFALPPVGPLRFKAPQPPLAWNEVRNVAPYPEPCPQLKVCNYVAIVERT